jgi:DNA-binding CsgD family transcriptional regulator
VLAPLGTPAARRARAWILDASLRARVDQPFLAELARHLRTLVPYDAGLWAATDPSTTLPTSPARVENLGVDCEGWWERELLVEDLNLFRDLARAPRPTATLHRASDGRPARSARFRALHRELGLADELRGVFRVGGATWGVMSLWRAEGRACFSAAEERLLAELCAPVGEAFRRGALLPGDGGERQDEAPGMLVFGRSLRLAAVNDEAHAWLGELPGTVEAGGGTLVPTVLLTVAAKARAIAAGHERGSARAHVQSRSGRWLVIRAALLRGVDGEDGRIAVVIEPARAADVAPIIVEAYGLAPREQQVTQMIARGLSTAQIASALVLSPHTVRDYVKQALEKVGVSSRGELVARLFAEHYLDLHHADAVAVHEMVPDAPLGRR